MAKDRSLEITTLRDALSDFGVATGTGTSTTTMARTTQTTPTTSRAPAVNGRTTAPNTSPEANGTDGDGSPSMEQLGAVSLLGALGAGILTYSRRNQ